MGRRLMLEGGMVVNEGLEIGDWGLGIAENL
jgi:hypothetical protein